MSDQETNTLAEVAWRSWNTLYGAGHLSPRSEIEAAVLAYNKIGFNGYTKYGSGLKNRDEQAAANLICQASHYGLVVPGPNPEIITRLIKAIKLLRIQNTTGGAIGNVVLHFVFRLCSANYRLLLRQAS